MKSKLRLFTRTALVIFTLSPLTPALSQTPPSSSGQGAGAVTNAEKSGKPGETSTMPRSSSSSAQGSSVGNTGAQGAGAVTNVESERGGLSNR